jgi:L,D-peptidoglycan transpeptidase YkuD (ErfK/YbiS/YcfS/YnhG family)
VPARRRLVIGIAASAIAVAAIVAGTVYVAGPGATAGRRGLAAATPSPVTPQAEPAGATAASDPRSSDPPSAAPPSTSPFSASGSSAVSPATSNRARAPSPTARPPADNAAARLRRLPARTRQVIIVSSDGFGSTHATVEAFTKANSGWQPAFGAMAGRIGTKGFADRKVEGDLTTPTGTYPIGSTMYGIAGNPGVRYAFHRLVQGDYWNEDPTSPGYNTFAHGSDPGGDSEALWTVTPQYRYFAVINYNVPVVAASPARGSAIFLHVMVPGRATAGCVAVGESDLVRLLTWLDPAASPRIVMAPRSVLGRY